MEYVLAAVVIIALLGAFFGKRYSDMQRAKHRRSAGARHRNEASKATDVDRRDAVRRARNIASRPKKERVELTVIGDERTPAASETYRAAYELIVRGIDVQLDMADVSREFGAMSGAFDVISPHTVSRMTYTTEAFAPHLESVGSMADFNRYAPYRADREMVLAVHPDDLHETYAVLKELDIRLSAMHHPDQMWWKPSR